MSGHRDRVEEGQLLWAPPPSLLARCNLAAYMEWLSRRSGRAFTDYESLLRWSISDSAEFWASIWDYFDVRSGTPYLKVLEAPAMQGAVWFRGSSVNYAEHVLRHEEQAGASDVAFFYASELRPLASMAWAELGRQVRIVATQLRALGIKRGDRIVAYMPNVPQTAVAMLATVAIGAIWSSAALEFGASTVIDRFGQIAPTILFASDGYSFAGKEFSRRSEVAQIIAGLPSLEHVIWVPNLGMGDTGVDLPGAILWSQFLDHPDVARQAFIFDRVPHDHPLWILFSSGTTGLPKAIVHSHVGVLIEHLKLMHFHLNLSPTSVMFFYSTTGWMMWNLLVSALLTGAAAVLYDGSPVHPSPSFLWKLAAETGTTSFGASPSYVQMLDKLGLEPGREFDLSRLESVVVAGSPSTPETFDWFYRSVKKDLWVTSQSGGTELCGALVGAVPLLPVYAGEIQARCLGMDVHAWNDEGKDIVDEAGELVVTTPFPSAPMYFWNDPDRHRYREAYFETFPGVWRHGDVIKINGRGGCYIYGRSDSTLNRHGVRIGTAEIYRALEQIDEVVDSLVVCCELPGGHFFMPLFLRLKPTLTLDDALRKKISTWLREACSPRHVPDRMYAVSEVPYTLTGKKLEVPVRKILLWWPPHKAVSRESMMNPGAIDYFARFAQESIDYQWRLT
jgi:acetoacetyl-CoA synthetase